MKKDGTKNFYRTDLEDMEENPSKKAMEIGRRQPYYLEVIRKEKKKGMVQNERGYEVSSEI